MTTNHLVKNLATSLLLYEKVDTTKARARRAKAYLEHLLSLAAANDLAARRQIINGLYHQKAIQKIFDLINPNRQRQAGQTALIYMYKLGRRVRDGAEVIRLILNPQLTEPLEQNKPNQQTSKVRVQSIADKKKSKKSSIYTK